jgi:hypothetical protein
MSSKASHSIGWIGLGRMGETMAARLVKADLAVMSLGPLAMWPVHDPVATVVMQGSGARMRDVLVAGRFAKRHGKLVWSDVAGVRARLAASGGRILSRLEINSVSSGMAATIRGRRSMTRLIAPGLAFALAVVLAARGDRQAQCRSEEGARLARGQGAAGRARHRRLADHAGRARHDRRARGENAELARKANIKLQ